MASLRPAYAVGTLLFLISLIANSVGQKASSIQVNEQLIKFRLTAHPVLELPISNTSTKAVAGAFRLELLQTNNKLESFVSGTFNAKPGTTVEKIEWPLNSVVKISPSELGWRRLHYSLVPRSNLGVPPAEGYVQLSRVLAGAFEVHMTGASRVKPGSEFPVHVRVDDPSNGRLCTELPSSSLWRWATMAES